MKLKNATGPGPRDQEQLHTAMQLKLGIILPVIIAAVVGFGLFAVFQDLQRAEGSRRATLRLAEQAEREWHLLVATEVLFLHAEIDQLAGDPLLQRAWRDRDRDALNARAQTAYKAMKRKFGITHFYFMDPDRTCFLRAHDPPKHGDVIDRRTVLSAQKTGEDAWGIELGPLGTFALRYVSPWKQQGELLGYLELGKEIDPLSGKLARVLGCDVVTIIRKEYTSRENFEEGRRVLGLSGQWDDFRDVVVVNQTLDHVPGIVEEFLDRSQSADGAAVFTARSGEKTFSCSLVHVPDAADRHVAHIVVMREVTGETAAARNALLKTLAAAAVLVGGLLLLLRFTVGKVERQLGSAVAEYDREYQKRCESEKNLAVTLNSIGDGVIATDVQGRVVRMNPAAERLTGRPFGEAAGRPLAEVFHMINARTREPVADPVARVLETGDVVRLPDQTALLARDGDQLGIADSAAPIRDSAGNITGVVLVFSEVTEILVARQALQASEASLQGILQSTADGILAVNKGNQVLFANERFVEMWMIPKRIMDSGDDALLIQCVLDQLSDPQSFLEKVQRLYESDEESFDTLHFKDGRAFDRLSRPMMQGAELRGRVWSFRDITERKRAEEAGQTEKEKYRILVKQVPGIVFKGYADYGLDCFDNKIEALTGYTQGEFNSRTIKWNDVVLEEYVAPVREQLTKALKDDGFYVSEFRIRKKSGEVIWVQARNQVVKNAQGRMDYISGVFFDITDRKRIEEALRESEDKYRQLYAKAKRAAEVYRSLLSSSADAIVIYDLEGNVQFLSPSFTRIFGWTLEELAGKRIPFVPDSEREASMAEVRRVIAGSPCSNFETRRYDKDGRILNITLSASRFDDHEGMPAGMLVILRDVTHTKVMERQYLQAQKMEAVGTLAGGVAHDFNNLLQAIGGYTELLLLDKSANDAGHSSLMQIKKACDRATQLIRQLLAFSRKAEGVRRCLDLNQEVLETEKVLQRTIPKMITIELHLAGGLWSVHADPVQIEQILLNLGTNADDAMPDGGRLTIETFNASLNEAFCRDHLGAKPGNYVLLSVSDTGRGMDPETLQHIFEPFFTTKEIGKGTGLGLASVYGIVKGLGGYIMCSSEPGQGTSFRIYLPAVEQWEAQAEGGVDETPLKGGDETILVVDDEAPVRDVATQILQHFGYEVLSADSGETALELYKTRKGEIDLVILDLGMPGMGGHKCLRELRALDPSVKVVVASGYSINGQVRESLEFGAGGFVGKPYQLKDLVTTVRTVLDAKQG